MQALPGFAKDHEANLKEAAQLLAEASYPRRFQTVLTNRSITLPSIDLGVSLISAGKNIGVEAEQKREASATWSQVRLHRDVEFLGNPFGSPTMFAPDALLTKFLPKSPSN